MVVSEMGLGDGLRLARMFAHPGKETSVPFHRLRDAGKMDLLRIVRYRCRRIHLAKNIVPYRDGLV